VLGQPQPDVHAASGDNEQFAARQARGDRADQRVAALAKGPPHAAQVTGPAAFAAATAPTYVGDSTMIGSPGAALPLSLPVTVAALIASPPAHIGFGAALGLGYIGVVSMCLGFFAWYQGMALGGVAAIGKLQFAQSALTLGWSAVLLGERVTWLSGIAAAIVIAAVAIGRNARVGRREPAGLVPQTARSAS